MQALLNAIKSTSEFRELLKGAVRERAQHILSGLAGTHGSFIMSALTQELGGPVLIIVPNEQAARKVSADLAVALSGMPNLRFPTWELLPYQVLMQSREGLSARLEVLQRLCAGDRLIVVAPIEALLRQLTPPDIFCQSGIKLIRGDRINQEGLLQQMVDWGYERADLVEERGSFSVRGGIIDIFPLANDNPVRIELFDDEIDSIREFSADTQRTATMLGEVFISPARELLVSGEDWNRGYQALKSEFDRQSQRLSAGGSPTVLQELADGISETLQDIEEHRYFDGIEMFGAYFYEKQTTLFDYLPGESACFVVEPHRVMEVVQGIQKEREEIFSDLLAGGKVLPGQYRNYVDWDRIVRLLSQRNVFYLSLLPRELSFVKYGNKISFSAKGVGGFLGRLDRVAQEIKSWCGKGFSVIILAQSVERADRIFNGLFDEGVEAAKAGELKGILPGKVVIIEGELENGFEYPAARLVLLTDAEILGQKKNLGSTRRIQAESGISRRELEKGDYVVHVNHGVGKYQGIVPLKVGDVQRDYLLVSYAGKDKLYVPTDQVDLLQKYVGSEGYTPRLSRLGGAEWAKVKSRVGKVVKEMAHDLLELYSARQSLPGHPFSKDTLWQRDFEAAFPYVETPDQLKAIEKVKLDMEAPQPMDRLLCGDVGYGKTEVALRAAFKSVMDGKQVAILVPTTILAQQHYNTFRERFADYPIHIEMLSRFRSASLQRKIIKELGTGVVDVVIGTHRLVQGDVKFKDLGLLVVDEEQRFGVSHKEKIKMLRKNVDVLTLTATPIPRTLHMSLVGVRDTSILATPPEERFPVQTYVLEEDALIIREAITRELNRGGQVYFVYNRVRDLDSVASWVSGLVPEARVAVAHGQMREDRLEQAMLDFMEGKYDILVCTTIIENGLDIQNVNTLIVKDADRLGLAQLYQLRGRVGRTNRLAYAYITFRKDKTLNEAAEKRLLAIKQFTEFGSGFKLAMRDLEIRGAGNLLGMEQHGHIAAVGYDLYYSMLEDAVKEAKGEPVKQEISTTIELGTDAFIPTGYIRDQKQKVDFYKRIAASAALDDVEELKDEMLDRYGDLPDEVLNLLQVSRVKVLGKALGIKSITRVGNYYKFVLDPSHQLAPDNLVRVGQEYAGAIKFKAGEDFTILLIARTAPPETLFSLERIETFLKKLAASP